MSEPVDKYAAQQLKSLTCPLKVAELMRYHTPVLWHEHVWDELTSLKEYGRCLASGTQGGFQPHPGGGTDAPPHVQVKVH